MIDFSTYISLIADINKVDKVYCSVLFTKKQCI